MRHSRKRRWAAVSLKTAHQTKVVAKPRAQTPVAAAQQLSWLAESPPATVTTLPSKALLSQAQATALLHPMTRTDAAVKSRAAPVRWWLALRFPHLMAQTFEHDVTPTVVVESTRQTILAANAAARRLSIEKSMPLAEAQWREASLRVQHLDEPALAQALRQLAFTAQQFTPWVSLEAPEVILLEIKGSVRLWGGLELFLQAVQNVFKPLAPYQAALATNTTAALWLSLAAPRSCGIVRALAADAQRQALDRFPVTWLAMTACAPAVSGLQQLGVANLLAVKRLPRAGVNRRFGVDLLKHIDTAYGKHPALPAIWVEPLRFKSSLEPEYPIEQAVFLKWLCRQLLEEMARFLARHAAGVSEISILLVHRNTTKPAITRWVWRLREPSASVETWLALGGCGYFDKPLPAPVHKVTVRSGRLRQDLRQGSLGSVLEPLPAERDALWWQWLTRAESRLGRNALQRVQWVAAHRPECAMAHRAASAQMSVTATAQRAKTPLSAASLSASLRTADSRLSERPLWLLKTPERLVVRTGKPLLQGEVQFITGPERISSGWWEGVQSMRDYYIVLTLQGLRAWVFRDGSVQSSPHMPLTQTADAVAWYLHGWFG